MRRRIAFNPNMILSPGTQVVTRTSVATVGREIVQPVGAVGEITKSPVDHTHAYRVRFTDIDETFT